VVLRVHTGVRDNDGRNLDHTTLEQLRIRPSSRSRRAPTQAIAEALGLARSTVYAWMANYRQAAWTPCAPARSPAGHPASPTRSGNDCMD
jgi:Helix-turn-helix domain